MASNLNLPTHNGVIESIYQQDKSGSTTSNPDHVGSSRIIDSNGNSAPSMNDFNTSRNLVNKPFTTDKIFEMDYFKGLKHSRNLFSTDEIDLYNKTYRFGLLNPDMALSGVREVLFFTKPDLSIFSRDDNDSKAKIESLSSDLQGRTFWQEMFETRKNAMMSLQGSADGWTDPFNHLLQNTVSSNLSIPDLSSEGIDSTKNSYGVNITYRSSSEASNDSFDFSLEFRDTKWLDVYYYFKMYEEYETLKHHGAVRPWKPYVCNKILHDQFSIYKFLLDDDNETIIYFAKYWGVYPKSLPRDTFSNTAFDTGIVYNIDFKGQFFDDSDPIIIDEFNRLSASYFNDQKYRVDVYNDILGRIDGRAATAAYVFKEPSKRSPTGQVFKLKWKGSDVE